MLSRECPPYSSRVHHHISSPPPTHQYLHHHLPGEGAYRVGRSASTGEDEDETGDEAGRRGDQKGICWLLIAWRAWRRC